MATQGSYYRHWVFGNIEDGGNVSRVSIKILPQSPLRIPPTLSCPELHADFVSHFSGSSEPFSSHRPPAAKIRQRNNQGSALITFTCLTPIRLSGMFPASVSAVAMRDMYNTLGTRHRIQCQGSPRRPATAHALGQSMPAVSIPPVSALDPNPDPATSNASSRQPTTACS
ncbi:hypothetical protein N658DRAFT_352646 [Parathielavia hyrcaniae]|uniref:Uncharacterized protein n=1 Tax=Parathielavia hyrcaniae TaxID=113614 RepID=A0AAN6Q3F2_9PEZI|nr:hypothetical protein N658DRAFT_352646 [Parathielavia hyrcaniae]